MKQINYRLVMFSLALSSFVALVQAQTPEWIWSSKSPGAEEVVFFRKVITVPENLGQAILVVSCDNEATVWVNGKQVARNTEWSKASRANVSKQLKAGPNVIGVEAKNHGSAAALLVQLTLVQGGKKTEIGSDASWSVSPTAVAAWQTEVNLAGWAAAVSLGAHGIAPWGDVLKPAVATAASTIKALPGFKVDLIKSSENEGSWVAMAIDPKGRLIISPQEGKGNLLRLTLSATGSVESSEVIDVPVGGAMGLLYAFDSLYVSGSGPNGLGLYRLRDTNGDDKYDKVDLLRAIESAGGEHGSHALVLGPDKKSIYYIHGNFVKVPDDLAPTSPHRNYGEDMLLKRGEDGNGFGVGIKPPGSFILRMDANGKNAEMVAGGMRNAYDFDFNPEGEMFAYDSDMEWDWGTPWYRPTRIYHMVSGGDYGFREGTAKNPSYFPDILPPTVDIGVGSPTGVKFGTGAKFSGKYQRALYTMDWSYGRISAVHLTPQGASYSATHEDFIVGKPLNVTDMEIGQDGALYFLTGGRGTQSGLYRVTYTGSESTAPVGSVRDEAAAGARHLRHQLEAFHGKKDPKAVDFAWPHLASTDRWIRYAARIAIEAQDVSTWIDKALSETGIDGSLTALLAVARMAGPDARGGVINGLAQMGNQTLSEEQLLAALRVLSVSFIRQGPPSADIIGDIVRALEPMYPAKSEAANRELSQILIYLEAPEVVGRTLDLLANAKTQEEQLHYVFHLRNLKTGWTLAQRQAYFTWLNRDISKAQPELHPVATVKWFTDVGRDYGDGASYGNFIKNISRDAVATLSDHEKGELAGYITGKTRVPSAPVKARAFVQAWKMEEIVPALAQVGQGRNFAQGKDAYIAAQCATCHRLGNEGGAVGPDLTAVSSRFTRVDVLSAVIEPSKVVSEQYLNTTFLLKNDQDVTGRILEENDQKVVLLTDALNNVRTEVKKADVKSRAASKLSSMPEGLVNVLSKEELLDLLAYMESAGKSTAPNFTK